MGVRDACPGCGSIQFKKNGHIHSGKQNHRCKACGRQFVASAEERIIADEQHTLIEHLLCERIWPYTNIDTGGEFLRYLQGGKGGATCLRPRSPRQPLPKPHKVR